ncbi:hypothetical protein [Pseudomonas sp. MYb185]|uniref:hypothetical protein n=1 Tax=Pseudomonas sp. MYb185 TaxID=1848729 RepID=UPI000CFC1A1E|nr:hypothetical protein [Pseudomonas sp. MYb185]PRB80499.1 hypothetical protein CQ007_12305 [Pseudomonas sp. MYb185]
MIRSVEAAKERLSRAQQDLEAATAAAYPKDTIVTVELGGHMLQLKVTGIRGAYWTCPGQMVGVNTKTGKARTFYDSDVIRIDHMPHTPEPPRETLFKPGEGEALLSLIANSAQRGGDNHD